MSALTPKAVIRSACQPPPKPVLAIAGERPEQTRVNQIVTIPIDLAIDGRVQINLRQIGLLF